MSEEEEKFNVDCPSCGIKFGFSPKIEEMWRESHKQFYCPNGHTLSWKGETPSEKSHRDRAKEIKKLQEKLDAALKDIENYKKKIVDLTAELEVWKPREANQASV